jgi:hypothetical protein
LFGLSLIHWFVILRFWIVILSGAKDLLFCKRQRREKQILRLRVRDETANAPLRMTMVEYSG